MNSASPRKKSQKTAQETLVTTDGYSFQIDRDVWVLSRDIEILWSKIRPHVENSFFLTFKDVLKQYAISRSAAHTSSIFHRLLHFVKWASKNGNRISEIDAISLANYRVDLGKRNEYYVGVIGGLIRRWDKLGYPGLGNGLLPLLEVWRLKGNVKGEAIQLQSIEHGAFSDLEFEALYLAVSEAFQQDQIILADFALVMLSIFSGRRPIQIADLKSKDFLQAIAGNGLTEYVLAVPRRKQRGGSFRSDFKPFALNVDNGETLLKLIQENNKRLTRLQRSARVIKECNLPLFPKWDRVKQYVECSDFERSFLPGDFLHLSTWDV